MLQRSKLFSLLLALVLSDVALGCLKPVDNRKQIAAANLPPHKFIPHLSFKWTNPGYNQICSGALMNRMGPPNTRVILTAAHCLVLPNQATSALPDQVDIFFPGMKHEATLTMSPDTCQFTISPGYQNTAGSLGDWALITCKQGEQVNDDTFPHGGFGWRADFTTSSSLPWSFPLAFSAGWPVDKDGGGSQWQTTGALLGQTPSGGNARWSLGDMSIYQGQDGAPVWVYDTMGHPQVVGVVSDVVSTSGCQNYATMMTPDMIASLHSSLWDSLSALNIGYTGLSLQAGSNNDYLSYYPLDSYMAMAPPGSAVRLFLLIKISEYYSEQDIPDGSPNQFTAKYALQPRNTRGTWVNMDASVAFPCTYSSSNTFPTGCGYVLALSSYANSAAFAIRDFRTVSGPSDVGLVYSLAPTPAFISDLGQQYYTPKGQITSGISVHTTLRFTMAVPY